MRRRLTEQAIPRLAEGIHWDTLLPSFGIRIGAQRKTWIIARRRSGSPHPVRIKVGTWPSLSLGDARTRGRALLAGDAPRRPVAFRELAEQFLDDGRSRSGRPWRPATAKAYRIMLDKAESLHKRPIADIRRRDIAALLRTIAATSPASAALAKAALSRFWGWLVEHDFVEANIVLGTSTYTANVGDRVLSDTELRRLWQATMALGAFGAIIRLCLWTGCRRQEAGGVLWREFQDGVWTIPSVRVKTGRELVLPLAQQTVADLARLPQVCGPCSAAVGWAFRIGIQPSNGWMRSCGSIRYGGCTTSGGRHRRASPGSASAVTWSVVC